MADDFDLAITWVAPDGGEEFGEVHR